MKQEKEKKIYAAIYCRVSTHEQGKGDFSSLDSQEAQLRKHCSDKGWTVYNVYKDTKTGSTLDRDELNNLIGDAEQGRFNVIVVTKLDRISRSTKDFLNLDEKLKALDVGIVTSTQDIDTTSSHGKALRSLMMVFAELERNMIADRTREKLFTQAQKGLWHGGLVLLGYDVVDKKLVVNEEEAKLVRRIYQYYLAEPSTNKVAARLNSEGYKTKVNRTKDKKTIGGGAFNNSNVKLILKSKLYIGIITYKDQDFKGIHDAIVDPQVFDDVQKELVRSQKHPSLTLTDTDLLLLGLTKCGYCGKNLTTSYASAKSGDRYFYYKCSTKLKFGSSKCECSDIPAEQLEGIVDQIVLHLGVDDKFFNAVAVQMNENGNIELRNKKENVIELKKNVAEIDKQIHKLVDWLATKDDGFPTQQIDERLVALNIERSGILEKITQLERQIDITTKYNISTEQLRKHYQKLSEVYTSLPAEKKRQLAQIFISSVECFIKKKEDKGKLKFSFRGDGILEMDWFKKEAPETLVSSAWGAWLRG